jgi:hypothetical protein
LQVRLHGEGTVFIDRDVVRQTVALLLEHAIAQTPAGGAVPVSLVTGNRICLTIQDGDGSAESGAWAGLRLASQVISAEGGELVHEAEVLGRSVTRCLPTYHG